MAERHGFTVFADKKKAAISEGKKKKRIRKRETRSGSKKQKRLGRTPKTRFASPIARRAAGNSLSTEATSVESSANICQQLAAAPHAYKTPRRAAPPPLLGTYSFPYCESLITQAPICIFHSAPLHAPPDAGSQPRVFLKSRGKNKRDFGLNAFAAIVPKNNK